MLMLIFSTSAAWPQSPVTGKINGQVLDENKNPLEFATIMLLSTSDSSLVKGAISDVAGKYEFMNIAEGNYLVSASMVGYQKIYTRPFILQSETESINLASLALSSDTKTLTEVVVVGEKPFIEQKLDRMVVNVANSIVSSGGTALEVLEKAPGITVDQNDVISLKGKQGIIVMIDGKQSYLSASEVSNMLRNMQSNAIEQIEIITNPSAKYDAAGNSGIINIKLKKDKNMGMNGNINAGVGYGKFEKYNGGLNLNYRQGKVNFFGNYNYGYNKRFNSLRLQRRIVDDGTETFFDAYNYRPMEFENHSYKAGVDFSLNEKNTLGFIATGFFNDGTMEVINDTKISHEKNQVDSSLILFNNATSIRQSMSYNLNYRKTFDSTDREFTIDLDYSNYEGESNDNIRNFYYNSIGEETGSPLILKSIIPSIVDIKSIKADYVHPLGNGAKLEIGMKSSHVTTDNDVRFDLYEAEQWTVDTTKTNHFKYTENINAGYLNFSKEYEKLSLQLGLRAEQTISEGNSITLNKVVKRNYLEFFPSIFVSQKLGKDHQLGYSYSRRIDRPTYQDLNPFIYFLDVYSYFEGNPFLKPSFTNSFEISHTFKGMFITSLGYSHTKDVFTQVTEQNDETMVTKATMANLNSQKNYSLGLTIPVNFTKWWTASNNLSLYYNRFESEFQGGQLDLGQLAYNLNSNHNFTLPNNFSAEVSGMYRSPTVDGIVKARSMYFVAMGIQKTFLDKKATLKLNVHDIFNTMRFRGDIDYQNMDVNILAKWESRQARLTFTYRFGNNDIKPARRRTTGSEAEQNRIKVDGN